MTKETDRSGRSRSAHLTPDEIESLRRDYLDGVSAKRAGARIRCTRRTAQKYYSFFRDECVRRETKQVKASRFYTSNFEL